MATVAYYMALGVVMAVPAALLSLFALNLTSPEWRRANPVPVRILRVFLILAVMVSVFVTKHTTLRLHFGVKVPLVIGAIVLFGASLYLRVRMLKVIPAAVAFEFADASADGAGELATNGIYSRIRHPGYVAMTLAVAAVALFTNYAAAYAVAIVYVPLIYLAARLEERELDNRFPGEYSEYCESVPRFFPRLIRQAVVQVRAVGEGRNDENDNHVLRALRLPAKGRQVGGRNRELIRPEAVTGRGRGWRFRRRGRRARGVLEVRGR